MICWPRQCSIVSERSSGGRTAGRKEEHMNAIPELTAKQNEALDTLVDLFRRSRKNDPDARTAFLGVALLLAQQSMLDYLVAALLTQAQTLKKRYLQLSASCSKTRHSRSRLSCGRRSKGYHLAQGP